MNNTLVSTTRPTGRLICVWVPTGNSRAPLACVWIEDQYYPEDCASLVPSFEERETRDAGRMKPCA